MPTTPKLFAALRAMHQRGGYGEVTTNRHAADRIHPVIARNLLDLGWAVRGNRNLITLTERGQQEAEWAARRSEVGL